MNDLRTDLYVALRAAPKPAKRRFGAPRGALEGDAGTRDIVDIVMKVLDRYTLEPRDLPPPGWPTCGGGA
ncbi:MAG TPA: hypothetical protein PK417_07915 [Hyphomonas sp.]|nr:hypothetical protein [Hyphomonas sp.]